MGGVERFGLSFCRDFSEFFLSVFGPVVASPPSVARVSGCQAHVLGLLSSARNVRSRPLLPSVLPAIVLKSSLTRPRGCFLPSEIMQRHYCASAAGLSEAAAASFA